MRTMAVWLGAVLMAGGLWSASVISQGLADEPAAPSSSSEATGSAAGNETGGSDAGPPPEAGEVQERTVLLTQAVHFTDAKGQDVVVGPGSYRVDAESTNRIRLLPAETAEAVVIDAVSFTHQQTVENPVPVTVPDPQQPDVLHLALLFPGGTGLDAIGTYSGLKPRAVTDMTIIRAAIVTQVTAAPTMQFTAVVPGITGPTTGTMAPPVPGQPTFLVVSYGGKCLDFAPPPQVGGAPVFINTCHGDNAQQVVVQEINDRHEVILRAGTMVIGVRGFNEASRPTVTARAVGVPADAPLELQIEQNRLTATALGYGQIFVLDGDSIILAADRTRVVKVLNNRGQDKTPLVLGSRDLADNEFWTFVATDKSNRPPTSGFVRVTQEADIRYYISGVPPPGDPRVRIRPAGPGTVIDMDPNASIELTGPLPLDIPAGVTIRSNRRGTNLGAELWMRQVHYMGPMLEIVGSDVRITGLRLRGTNGTRSVKLLGGVQASSAIRAYTYTTTLGSSGTPLLSLQHTIIDHNDLSNWTDSGVDVFSEYPFCSKGDVIISFACDCPRVEPPQQEVLITRNFIHDNVIWPLGYGVLANHDAYASIVGNTFLRNRHAIAGGAMRSGYRARFNIVQSATPDYGDLGGPQQDFDMHGSGPLNSDGAQIKPDDKSYVGGVAGDYMESVRNTFLAGNRLNFYLRGTSCRNQGQFRTNVSLGALGNVIKNMGEKPIIVSDDNQFNAPNPTDRLGVGDFDGDGLEDLFLATGAAWYYAPAGNAEWRFLNAQPDGIGTLLFGDFDADGRTDVFTQHGANWDVSWGGASQWDTINVSGPILGNAAIGDFNGDHYADVFWSGEGQWFISDRGVGPFIPVNTSSYRVADLGFGDFNGDGKTDVVGVVGGQWMVSLSATGLWAGWPLRPALTNTMAGLMIADFNGDGLADIATAELGYMPSGKSVTPFWKWKVSWAGKGGWTALRTVYGPPVGVGRFDATRGADILVWEGTNSNTISILSSSIAAPSRQSRQDMR